MHTSIKIIVQQKLALVKWQKITPNLPLFSEMASMTSIIQTVWMRTCQFYDKTAHLISCGSPDCSRLYWRTAILHNVFKLGPEKKRRESLVSNGLIIDTRLELLSKMWNSSCFVKILQQKKTSETNRIHVWGHAHHDEVNLIINLPSKSNYKCPVNK